MTDVKIIQLCSQNYSIKLPSNFYQPKEKKANPVS